MPAGICPLRVGSLQWVCGCPRRVGLSDPLGFLPFLCLLRMGWGQTQLTEGQSIKNSNASKGLEETENQQALITSLENFPVPGNNLTISAHSCLVPGPMRIPHMGISSSLHNMGLVAPFYRWGSCSSERFSHFPKVTQWERYA